MRIKDIARMAGVAPSTVSRVLNNSGYISAEIREKVEAVVRETGYVPNRIAQSLKRQSTRTIGIIIPQIASETMSRLVEAAYGCCNRRGYRILLENTQLDSRKELDCLKSLYHQQVEGILLMSTGLTAEHREIIQSLDLPVIVTGQYMDGLCCYTHDNRQAAREMVLRMAQKGRRRIALLNVSLEEDNSIKIQRELGYRDALATAGLSFDESLTAYGAFTIDSGREMMKALWENCHPRPDAVFAVTDKIAIGAMEYLAQKGVSVPGDCMVAGVGNNKLSEFIRPPLSTIEFFYDELGSAVTDRLLDAVESGEPVEGVHLMRHRIIERESTNGNHTDSGGTAD